MNIYVETNFVLELVFDQEQRTSCEEILQFCELGKSRLVIPAYSLAEPHEKLNRQRIAREQLQQSLDVEIRQLNRSAANAARIGGIQNIANLLVQSNDEEEQRFIQIRDRLINAAEFIPLTVEVFREAATYETPLDLRPQDAIVFASVIGHLRQQLSPVSCFLNRNSRDFDIPQIVDELSKHGCTMIPRFDHGYGFIQSRVQP